MSYPYGEPLRPGAPEPTALLSAYPPPTYPAPPAARAGFGTGLLVGSLVGFVAASVVAAVVGVVLVSTTHHGGASTRTVTAHRPTVRGSGRTHPGALGTYAVPAPADSRPWRTKPTDETLTLDQAAALSKDTATRAEFLRRYDFQSGFVRHWITPKGTIVSVRLYRFGGVDLAAQFYDEDVRRNIAGDWGQPAEVAGVPDGKAFASRTVDSQGYAQALSMAVGGDIVVAVIADELAPADSTTANQIVAAQYARL